MLKYKLTALDGLTDEQKSLYKEVDGSFILQIDGMPDPEDTSGLKKKNEQLLAEKKAEQEAKRLAEETARKEAEDKAKAKGDFEALAKQYEEKLARLEEEKAQAAEKTAKQTIAAKAMEIASGMAEGANQKILSRFISERLRVENGEIKVTDEDGNLTISSIDDLSKEFQTNQDFESLITASKASGGGGSQSGGKDSGAAKRSEMTTTQRADFIRENGQDAYLQLPK